MAIINRIRERAGLAIGVVAVSLLLFIVGGDILSSNSRLLGRKERNVGEIAGNTISLKEYQAKIDELRRDYLLNNRGDSPDEQQMKRIRDRAWEQMIFEKVHKKQFEKLGIQVTDEELVDMVQGDNIHPSVMQVPMFKNPKTKKFDRKRVVRFLQNFDRLKPRQKAVWNNFENSLPDIRLTTKYTSLLNNTNNVTTPEARKWFMQDSKKADVNYLFVPYNAVEDSKVKVSDKELKKYIKNHKEKYKVDPNVVLDFVSFPIIPSKEDTAYYKNEINELKPDFANTEDDSTFVGLNSDGDQKPHWVRPGNLPDILVNNAENMKVGKVYGPFLDNDFFKLFKISDKKKDTAASVRASHILIKWDSESPEDKRKAKQKASDVLRQIKQGASFSAMARQYGQDATSKKGGDLGWFGRGKMVKPFEKAVFNKEEPGLIPHLVETKFGYHIIKVTQTKTKLKYKLATVKREIIAGDNTRNKVYRKADVFAGTSENPDKFYKKISENKNLQKLTDKNVSKDDQSLKGINDPARDIIRWAYNEASVGDISTVFELQEHFVVALLKDKRSKGVADLEDVRDDVTREVKKQKKSDKIISKLGEASKDFDAMKQQYPKPAVVKTGTAKGLSLSSSKISGIGEDPMIIGRALGLTKDEVEGPFAGEKGVAVLKLLNQKEPGEFKNRQQYVKRIKRNYNVSVDQAIKDIIEVKDERYKHF